MKKINKETFKQVMKCYTIGAAKGFVMGLAASLLIGCAVSLGLSRE